MVISKIKKIKQKTRLNITEVNCYYIQIYNVKMKKMINFINLSNLSANCLYLDLIIYIYQLKYYEFLKGEGQSL